MKKSNKSKRKKLYKKRMRKRNRKKVKEPQIQWLTDTMFALFFYDEDIDNIFSYVTVEVVDEDNWLPCENNQHLQKDMHMRTEQTDCTESGIVDLN